MTEDQEPATRTQLVLLVVQLIATIALVIITIKTCSIVNEPFVLYRCLDYYGC
jgi:hypothetical protein